MGGIWTVIEAMGVEAYWLYFTLIAALEACPSNGGAAEEEVLRSVGVTLGGFGQGRLLGRDGVFAGSW